MQSEESCAEEYGSDQFFKYAGAIEEAEKRQFETDEQFREMLLKLDVSYNDWNWFDKSIIWMFCSNLASSIILVLLANSPSE